MDADLVAAGQVAMWCVAGGTVAWFLRVPGSGSAWSRLIEGALVATLFATLFVLGAGGFTGTDLGLGPTVAAVVGTVLYVALVHALARVRPDWLARRRS